MVTTCRLPGTLKRSPRRLAFDVFLPSVAWEFSESTPRIPAAYLLQSALVRHGAGSVAAFGEAAMFRRRDRMRISCSTCSNG